MFELSMVYYVVGVALFLLLVGLLRVQIIRKKRERQRDRSLYVSALQSLLEGDQVGAFYKLKEVVAQDTENIDAYLRLGKILADRGKPKQAIQIHSELLLRSNLAPEQKQAIHHYLIDDYILDGQIPKAISYLKSLYERDPTDGHAGLKLLDLLEQQSNMEEAEEVAEKIYKRNRESFRARLADVKIKVADAFAERAKGRKARTLYKTAFHLDPQRSEIWIKVGDSYATEDRLEDAVKSWMHYTELSPSQSHQVFERLRRSLFEMGQFNQISGIYEAILEKDPNNVNAAMALADLFEKKGNRTVAEEYYRQVRDQNPGFMPAHLGLARIYREQGKIDEAFEILEKVFSRQSAIRQET